MFYVVTGRRARAKHIHRTGPTSGVVCQAQAFVRLHENRPDIPVCFKCAEKVATKERPFFVTLSPGSVETMVAHLANSHPVLAQELGYAFPVTENGRRAMRMETTAERAEVLLEQMKIVKEQGKG